MISWFLADLTLLATDAQQLRIHLEWLQEDLRTQRAQLDGQAQVLDELVDQLVDCHKRLQQINALLARSQQQHVE